MNRELRAIVYCDDDGRMRTIQLNHLSITQQELINKALDMQSVCAHDGERIEALSVCGKYRMYYCASCGSKMKIK